MKQDWEKKAAFIRKWSLISTTQANSGHPTSCLSPADLVTVLFDKYFSYDLENPLNPFNDRFILSKGHAAPLLYIAYAMAGAFPIERLKHLRKINSELEGHPTPEFKYTEAATGSLGQGLSVGAGLAYAAQKDKTQTKTFVLLGDGELAEGSVWEAANFSSYYKLNNLIAILDINRLGQSQATMYGHFVDEYITKFSAFNWEVMAIDGHSFKEIDKAFEFATKNISDKPFVIIARTLKGKGVSFLEDKDNWHGKPLKKEELEKALKELGEVEDGLTFKLAKPKVGSVSLSGGEAPRLSVNYKKGEEIGTREVYGKVLAEVGSQMKEIYALDGDTKNSTYSQDFLKVHPDRFIECFIAEQNMVGVSVGLQRVGKIPFASTFAAFFTRAFDQIRMAGVSKANIKFVGSHAGVSIGEDGPSQMGLEDLAMFGSLPDAIIFHTSDAVSTAHVIPLMIAHKGIAYLRTLRPKTPVLYNIDEEFVVGGSKILKSSKDDMLTIAACGITVHESQKAYEQLQKEDISVRILDCYCVKPIDKKTLVQSAKATKKPIIITVEDHFEHGGLGDFVLSAVSSEKVEVIKMAVGGYSHSGLKDELLDRAGISSKHIAEKVKNLL